MMNTPEEWSSATLLADVQAGDPRAAKAIFDRYVERLTRLAQTRLSPKLASRTDPEDIMMSAWRSFFVGARAGRFSLQRSGDLWRLLVSITLHKLYRQARHHSAARRNVGAEQSLSSAENGWEIADEREPTPDEAIALADEVEAIFNQLDPLERSVLEMRLQGEPLGEISRRTGRAERTVRRALGHIRQHLARRLEKDSNHGSSPSAVRALRIDPRAPLAYSDYILEQLIGDGATGKVYRARQISLDRPVAIKYLRKSLMRDSAAVERFIAEVEIVARLDHPRIVTVHGLGKTPGSYFIAMELIEGRSLASTLRRGPISIVKAVGWIVQACEAIEHAHERGVIHCDLKPANLLMDQEGAVHVADFGFARVMNDRSARNGRLEGTAPFMAPEQISEFWGPIGPRTDVYGLGAVLFTLLAGRPPWSGSRMTDVLVAVTSTDRATPLRELRCDVPADLASICEQTLSKAPAERIATVAELRQALLTLAR
jgi:RNA polymerase sigma factor (sigma-70 family)